jgi:nicotinate-nucleotide adenylyltransferase
MKIGIMGGTFNPIHNAHLIIAQLAAEQYKLDRVWFMTSGNPPHKTGHTMPDARVRHAMTELAIQHNGIFEACDYEVSRKEYSYTAHTFETFKNLYPEHEFYFIVGADSLCMLHSWYKPQTIAKLCTFLVFPRIGYNLESAAEKVREKFSAKVYLVDAPVMEISSSMIRSRITEKKCVKYFIPDAVLKYIEDNNLYKSNLSR